VVAVNPRRNSSGSRKGLAKFVERVNAPQMKDDLIPFRVGMTVKVGVTVVEGGKSRVQPYEGIVIAIHRAGVATTITVRKSFQGYGVERIFPIHSPLCSFEEVRGAGKPVARRAKLYYLRNLIGKKAKLKSRFVAKKTGPTRHQLKMEALAASKAEAAAAEAKAAEEAAAAEAAEAAAVEEPAAEEPAAEEPEA
jgi:ribosomal protein L19